MKSNKYKMMAFCAMIALIMMTSVWTQLYRISGDCMEPNIQDGHVYFLDRISPYIRHYQVGDVIVFRHEEKCWVSRIAALEASVLQIMEGSVMVDGSILQDKEIHRNWSGWKYGDHAIDSPLQIPLNHVFVLSDNLSARHDDSRIFGPIAKDSILGILR